MLSSTAPSAIPSATELTVIEAIDPGSLLSSTSEESLSALASITLERDLPKEGSPNGNQVAAGESLWEEGAIATVERVSLSSQGEEGIGFSASASLSEDGRFVAFSSTAESLTPGDINNESDIFLRDRLTGLTERISTGLGAAASYNPVISADGEFVAFQAQSAESSSVFVYTRDTEALELISTSETSDEGNRASNNADISEDGRFVVFQSEANNLVADDTNEASDIFLRDRQLNTIERLSLAVDGTQSNGDSSQAALSADGRFIAFTSTANNLVDGDTNNTADIFLYDRETQTIERISVSETGEEANGFSRAPSISSEGRYVSYDSLATNLVSGDTNQKGDVFVYDRVTQTTSRVSVSDEGEQSNNFSFNHGLSADGQFVSYSSVATNLVENDTNRVRDVFVFDQKAQTTTRVSVNAEGIQGNRASRNSVFSADSRFVAFQSSADILVDDDTNGRTDIFVYDFNPHTVPDLPTDPETASIIDLTGIEATSVMASIEVTRSAGYDNTVGWYVVENEQGGVKDKLTGEILSPEDEGYMQAAIAQRLDLNLTGDNSKTLTYETELETGSLLSTFIVSNGKIEALLDADALNDPNIFFGHLGANSDGEEHVRRLSDNTFGYEDLLGGGDRDFNDMVVKVSFV